MLALVGAVLAGYPALFPFQGQEMRDTTVDALAPSKTPAFEEWGIRNDGLARGGLFCVALATGAGAAAQLLEQTDGKTR